MNERNTWHNIIFFDGICVLCNRYVDFLVKRDKKKKLKFAAIQSDFFKGRFTDINNSQAMDSVIFYQSGRIFTRSDAVLRIMAELRFPYNLSCVFYVMPRFARDKIYDYFARNRYRWFGIREKCRMPDAFMDDRFIL